MNSEERVRRGAEKLQKFLNSKQQGRLDGFFSVKPKEKEKGTAPAKGKGKDKVDTKAKGTKRKVYCKILIFPPFPLTYFFFLCREKKKGRVVQERNLERNDLIRLFMLSKTLFDRVLRFLFCFPCIYCVLLLICSTFVPDVRA